MTNEEFNFEESIEKLENIVSQLEKGDISLDEATEKFNESMVLVKACEEKLNSARETITKIVDENKNIMEFTEEE